MKSLFVGIDPGTTLGYAVVDLDGNVLKVGSGKSFELSRLISNVISFGKAVVVGCDKKHIPSLVERFAAKTGAKIVYPREDLSVREKKDLVKVNVKNDHEMDALASALFAYKEYRGLVTKIGVFVKREGKENIRDKIFQLLVKVDGLNIKEAVSVIEKPEEVRLVKKIVEDKKIEQKDIVRLYKRIQMLEKDNFNLKMHNRSLNKKIRQLESGSKTKVVKVMEKNVKDKLGFKERTINGLNNKAKDLELVNKEKDKQIIALNNLVSKIGDNVLLKKLDNLGSANFEKRNKVVKIKKDDVLLVDDLSVISRNVIDGLKGKVTVVVYRKKITEKMRKNLPFVLIESSKLHLDETEYFAFVDKEEFRKVKYSKQMFSKILQTYKDERKDLLT